MEFNALGRAAVVVLARPRRRGRGRRGASTKARTSSAAFNPHYLVDGLTAAIGRAGRRRGPRRAEAGAGQGRGQQFVYLVMPVQLPAHVGWDRGPGRGTVVRLALDRGPRLPEPPGDRRSRFLPGSPRWWDRTARARRTSWRRCTTSARSSRRGSAPTSRSCGSAPRRRSFAARSRPRPAACLIEVEVRPSGQNRVQVNRSPVRRKRDLRRHGARGLLGPGRPERGAWRAEHRRRFMDEAVRGCGR